MQPVGPVTFEQFVSYLRSALHHLYDPDELRRSPLATFFGVANGFDAASALQNILIEAVNALEPAPTEPPQSRAWRIYDALVYRYIRGFDRQVVADQLGISGRQLRREQRAALEVLAGRLWHEHGLGSKQSEPQVPSQAGDSSGSPSDAGVVPLPSWLNDLPPEKPAPLGQVFQSVMLTVRPLVERWHVQLESIPLGDVADIIVSQVALRHALLCVLGVIVPRAQYGTVQVQVQAQRQNVEITVTSPLSAEAMASFDSQERASLEAAAHLAKIAGGTLDLVVAAGNQQARLALPALRKIQVLVVDDNADTLHLFGRYLAGTRYCFACTRDPTEVLRLVNELDPPIIVLDVMLPEVDGWELLAQLRSQPDGVDRAIIVCTVLPQEALALSLGANAFLQKPVTREAFLSALDQQSRLLGLASS